MIKWVIILLAVVGAVMLLGRWAPGLFSAGWQIPTTTYVVPWIAFAAMGVIFFGSKLHSK